MQTPCPFSLRLSRALAFGYLLGSIPFGLVFTRLAGTQDIRAIGSGSIGATNVLRTGSKGLAAATLLADMLKGTVAVLVMTSLWGRDFGLAAGVGAFAGHLWPAWLDFKGGKGVATFLGVLLAVAWQGVIAVRRALARGRRRDALLLARLADRLRGDPAVLLVQGRTRGSAGIPPARGPHLHHASRQHRAAQHRGPRARSARKPALRTGRKVPDLEAAAMGLL